MSAHTGLCVTTHPAKPDAGRGRHAPVRRLAGYGVILLGLVGLIAVAYLLSVTSRLPEASPQELAFQGIYQGALMSGVAIYAFNRAVELLGAVAAAAIIALVPVMAAVIAVAVLGEAPPLAGWVAIAAVAAGVALAAMPAKIALLLEETGRFLGAPKDRGELLSWLLFVASGLGPYSGQSVHFQRAAPEKLPYAINRYRREAERHWGLLDQQLVSRAFIVGEDFTIADMSAWGWIDRAKFVFLGDEDPMARFPNIVRWFATIEDRPAALRARKVGTGHPFKKEQDEEARRHLYPSNYPPAA